jgi:hypothetical protein
MVQRLETFDRNIESDPTLKAVGFQGMRVTFNYYTRSRERGSEREGQRETD